MMMGKLKISDIDIKENDELLEMIYNYNDNLELEFLLNLCEITDLFKYYVNRNIEMIGNLDNYDCVYPEFKFIDNELIFTLSPSDDEEDDSDIRHIDKEFKRHFGNSILKCKAENIFRILLIDCCSYVLNDDILELSMFYENYKETWLGKYLADKES